MANTRPFVVAAFFCENLIEDKDNVLTAIRIIDTYYLTLPTNLPDLPPDVKPAIEVTGLISLKSGDVVGPYKLDLMMRRPTKGEKPVRLSPEGGWPVVFNGGEHGVNLKMKFPLGVKTFGLYWFDVMWENELLTSIPLNLIEGEQPARKN